MAEIVIRNLRKEFGAFTAVKGSTFTIRDGEFFMLLGPSGCGKTTTLRMIAGLELPTSGEILIDGEDVSQKPASQRDIAMVFQMFALYPHMNVRKNISYPLVSQGMPRAQVRERVAEVARILGIEAILDSPVGRLSGGDRQRVALGRAIVREPKVFLFDEPLSNLDAKLRVETRAELARLHRRLRTTVVYVTHDQEEAMTLGTRVAVLRAGILQQVAPPMELYRRPVNMFVAGFVGSPEMNFLPGRLSPHAPGPGVVLGVRPHDIAIRPAGQGDLDATVDVVEPLGSELIVYLRLESGQEVLTVRAIAPPDLGVAPDTKVGLTLDPVRLHWFNADTGSRIS
jgi:multiple sugar transport system ATP-binding protein